MPRTHYGYDPLDRLITHQLDSAPPAQRFYNRERLSTQLQGDQRQSVFQFQNQLLATRKAANAQLLVTDQQRSVLLELSAGEKGALAYSPYGHQTAQPGQQSLLAFNGELPDPSIGHYLLGNGHRTYNTVLMRFNSPDRLSPFSAGGINAYAYCKGDPVNRVDPSGRLPLDNILSIALSTLGVASGINGAIPGIGFWSALKNLKKNTISVAAVARVVGTTVGITASVVGVGRQVAASKDEGDDGNALLWSMLGLSALGLAGGVGANVFGWRAIRKQARQAKTNSAFVETYDFFRSLPQGSRTQSPVSNRATPASSASVSRTSSSGGSPEPSAPPLEDVLLDTINNLERKNHALKKLVITQWTARNVRRSSV